MIYQVFRCDGCHKETPNPKDYVMNDLTIKIATSNDTDAFQKYDTLKSVQCICCDCAEALDNTIIDLFWL